MSMRSELKRQWKQFSAEPMGVRFLRHHDRQRGSSALRVVMTFGVGVLLVLAGLALGLVPGPGGFVTAMLGLVLLASSSRFVARALDRLEPKVRMWLSRARTVWPFGDTSARVTLVLALLTATTTLSVLVFR